jgi:anti-sigma factor RsiW
MSLSEEELRTFVDGELGELERARIEALLAEHPSAQRRVAELRAADARLRAVLRRDLTLPPNEELEPRLVRRRIEERRVGRVRLAAAALIALGVGAGGGWYARGGGAPPPMQDAVDAYRVFAASERRPVELSATDPEQLQAALAAQLGHALPIPHLEGYGFRLLGGRVLSTNDGPAALVLYQDATGAKLSFYWRSSSRTPAGTRGSREDRGLLATYWYRGGYGFAVVGDAADPRISQVQASFANEG